MRKRNKRWNGKLYTGIVITPRGFEYRTCFDEDNVPRGICNIKVNLRKW